MAAHVALFVFWAPTLAIAQNMVGPNMRASVAFLVYVAISLVGIGLGPTLLGILSDVFAANAFSLSNYAAVCAGVHGVDLGAPCEAASAVGIRWAMIAMSLLFVWAGVHYLLASRTLRIDLDTHYEPHPAGRSGRDS